MISIGDGIIIMTLPTGVFRAVRDFAAQGYLIPVINYNRDLRMRLLLRSPAQTGDKNKYKERQY